MRRVHCVLRDERGAATFSYSHRCLLTGDGGEGRVGVDCTGASRFLPLRPRNTEGDSFSLCASG